MKYELLYIVPAQYTDSEVEGVMKTVSGLVEKNGGAISRNESLGKIKLAYPINNVRHGTYVLVHFEGEPESLKGLEHDLRLADEILRHQVIVMPKGAEDKKYEISSYVAPLSEEAKSEKRSEKPAAAPAPAPAIAPPPPAPADTANMSVEELDKKLDELLEEDVTKAA